MIVDEEIIDARKQAAKEAKKRLKGVAKG